MIGNASTAKRPRVFYGWWIVLAGAGITTYGWGTFFYGFGLFFNPIRNEFAWTAAIAALAFSMRGLEQGVAAPIVGFLVDRLGPRILMISGVVVVGIGFLLLSQVHALTTFYVAFMIISVGFSFTGGPGSVAVVNWFSKKRTLALAVLMSATLPASFLPPLVGWVINQLGWRTTLIVIGIGMWVVCLPLAALVRRRPEPYGMLPDGDPLPAEAGSQGASAKPGQEVGGLHWTEALRERSFWMIASASALWGAAVSALLTLVVPYLESVGVSREQGAFGLTILGTVSVAGRLGIGYLGEKVDKRYLLAASYALLSVGILAFAFATNFWMAMITLLIVSPGYGAPVPGQPALMAQYFGRRHYGAIQGLSALVSMTGSILAPWMAALIFDRTGSYRAAWIIFAVLSALAIIAILMARPPMKSESRDPSGKAGPVSGGLTKAS